MMKFSPQAFLVLCVAIAAVNAGMKFNGKPAFNLMNNSNKEASWPKREGNTCNVGFYFFPGKADVFIKVPNKGDLSLKSLTIFALINQPKLQNGAIVEWPGKVGKFGTHFWIWHKKLFVNLVHSGGKHAYGFFDITGGIPPKTWSFVGMSYNHETGDLVMWINDHTFTKNVGKLDLDTVGDVYVGVRPKEKTFHPFLGYMSGVTVLPYAVSLSKFAEFKKQAFSQIFQIKALPKGDWCKAMTFNGKLAFNLIDRYAAGKNMPKYEICGPFGSKTRGSFCFPGKPDVFVRVPNNGNLNLKSLTIFTLINQPKLQNGAIVEWPGKVGKFGTHFWVWHKKLFVNLVHSGGKHAYGFFNIKGGIPANKWSFVGMSYNHETGDLVMWINGNTFTKNVGKLDLDTVGDVYVGVRPKEKTSHPFLGCLSGVTILPYAVPLSDFATFRSQVFQDIFGLKSVPEVISAKV